jgi:hypothetical protein
VREEGELVVIGGRGEWSCPSGQSKLWSREGTHWFAPFPPGPVEKEVAVRVSPPDGTRGVTVTRSMLREPMMVMVLGAILRMEWGGREGEAVLCTKVVENRPRMSSSTSGEGVS